MDAAAYVHVREYGQNDETTTRRGRREWTIREVGNVDEMLRMVDALQFHQEHGEVCPAGWNKGDKGMTATTEGVAAYLTDNADKL